MVFSRSDIKRRNKELQDPLNENPKRTKVHAQRKFAQGSGMNSPVKEMNIVKEKEKVKTTDDFPEELPTNQPPTEDFLSFLCFRGTKFLAPRLNVFNEAPSSQRKSSSSSKHSTSSSGPQKHKAGNSSQVVYKKRLGARRAGLQKGNAVRARTASNEREAVRKKAIERQIRRKAAQRRAKPIRKPHPSILKRLGATRLRTGLRSGGQLPPGSDLGLKTDRKPKRGRPKHRRKSSPRKSKMVAESKKRTKDDIEEEEEEEEEEDEEEEEEEDDDNDSEVEEEESEEEEQEKEPEIEEKSVTTRKSLRTRGASNSPAQSPKKQSPSGRPMRKTKVAATLYMEMLTKDLRNPEEEFDEDYVRNFPEPPSTNKKEKQEDLKKNVPKRGRQPKRGSSPIKDDKSKIRKLSKDSDKTEDISPLRKRHQRACTKKIVPRGRKPVLKVKGRLLRKNIPLKGQNLPLTRKILRTRTRGKPRKNLSENNEESDEDEVIDDEEEEKDEEDELLEVANEVDKKSQTSRGSLPETSHPKSRQTRSDLKKVADENTNKSISSNQKKRKNIPESSLSEGEDEFEEGKRKTNKTVEQDKRKKRFLDQKKAQKIENDNTRPTNNKRTSLRNLNKKEETENEDEKDSKKTKSPRRSKRNKESDEEQEQVKRGKFAESRRSKYKEESEDDFEEDYENPSKIRSSSRQKTSNKEDILEIPKNTKKNDDSEKVKTNKPNNKKIENETESFVRRGRGRLPKNVLKQDSDEETELRPRRSRVSNVNKSVYESDDDEEEEDEDVPLIKKTRGSVKGKPKIDVQDIKKKDVQEDGNSEMKKSKESQQRKSIPALESDEEISDSIRKLRWQQKKTKNIEIDERKSPEHCQSNPIKDELLEDKEKPKATLKKLKKQAQEKEDNLVSATPDVETTEILRTGKPTSRNKTKKSLDDNTEDNLELKETLPKKTRKNNISKDSDDKSSFKSEIHKKTVKEEEEKCTNDRQDGNETTNDVAETKPKCNKKLKKCKNISDSDQEEFSDNVLKSDEGSKKQKNSIAVTISSTKPEKIDSYFSNGPSVTDEELEEPKLINKDIRRDSIKSLPKENKKSFNTVKKDELTEIKTKVNLEITTEIENPQIQTEVIFKTNVTPSNVIDINQEISNIEINIKQEKDAYEIFLENVLNEEELKRKSKIVSDIKPENSNFGLVNDSSYSTSKKVTEIKDIKMDANLISSTSYKYVDLSEKGPRKPQKEFIESNETKVSSNNELLSRKIRKNANDTNFRDQIPSEETAVPHKVKPFSISEKINESEETHFHPFTNVDSTESKQFNSGRSTIGDKFNKNVFSCRIEGTHHTENNFNNTGSDNFNFRKGIEEVGRKSKKIASDFSSLEEVKKMRTTGEKYPSKDDMRSSSDFNKPRDSKIDENFKETALSKRHTRLSVGSPERDEKPKRKYESKDKFFDHYRQDSELITSKPGRKPSLTARAQLITKPNDDDDDDEDDDDRPPIKPSESTKPAAPIRRKSVGGRDSCDTIGSGSSIVECKVVLNDISESLGARSGDLRKSSKKSKHIERVPERCISNVNTVQCEETTNKDKNSLLSSTSSRNFGIGKSEEDNAEKPQVTKPSIGDTWRQAFKNAKIPKHGHISPVQHSVKPFIRQKLPNLSSSFQGKSPSDQRSGNSNKAKTSPNLSPFKSLSANQSQRSMSPDAKKHLSPAHKVSFSGYDSPGKRNEDMKCDLKKQEPPAKTLTQLQYEKRSSEFINSFLDPVPTLPAFESIRAYKKEMKKEEPREVVRVEPAASVPPPISEPVVKPSPEGKHLNLPLAVEHTLRKNSPITVSKKPPVKPVFPQEKRIENIPVTKPILPSVMTIEEKGSQGAPVIPPSASPSMSASCQTLPPVRDLLVREQPDMSAFPKKKVNMTTEEINRWLNDSTSTGIEHKKDCGIFENNQCECSYRTSEASMQNSVGVSELVPKDEKIDHGVVEPPVQLKELDKTGKYVAETISTCKVEDYKEKLLSKTSPPDSKMAPPRARRSSGHDKHKSNKSMTEDEMCEYDFRFDRISNSPRESMSDVSSVTQRDDASSSSEIPERKIFHQKRTSNSKRPSLSSPTAFSAENESSIYAFDPDPDPPASAKKPFRRGRGKSGEQDDKNASSSSIAVQVNLHENEGGLECSTQTERSSDDDDVQLFYIPLPDEQLHTGLPQGVAVKVDTEGPEQRVIMRAKLVTKPNNSFPSAASVSNCRGFHHPRRDNHPRPAQKVRPLWPNSGRAPVGKVHPTMREPDKSDQGTTTTKEKCRPSGQVSQSTQISQTSPDSPRASRNSNKGQKQTETKPLVETAPFPTAIEWRGTEFPSPDTPPTFVEAPTFYPTEKEFQDPLEYIEQLTPLAQSFGICRIVPPASFKPECKVSDDMRFTAYNQYVHKLMERWGPNVKELCAIKKYLTTQSINLTQLPLIGSMEVDLPRLYQTVQQQGGLKEVIEKKRWARVADAMRIPKSAQDRLTKLDDIYCKYLLPYDTLSHAERSKLLEEVEEDWQEREKRRVAEDEVGNSAEGSDDTSDADDNLFECISKGKNMPLSGFYRIARNTMYMWFKENTPSPGEVEAEFWQHVSNRNYHVCVHCGSIDSGTWGYGFPTTKTSATSRHPWNLKVLTNSPGSILRSLGPVMGVTVPTLHVGMLFSSCCWYRDPHGLPWIEYLHTGASKIWYGVPGSRATELRNAMYPLLPRHTRDKAIWLPSDTMMVPPQYLLEGGVSVCRVVQEPGQFVLVFPKAFTSTISTGYIVSESVYFAQPSWLNTALQVFKDIHDSCEPPVFSLHKLLFSIANDTRSSADILIQILPMLTHVIESEVGSRKKLEKLGLTSWERLPSGKAGRRKKQEEEPSDLECDTCRGALFLSMVTNSNEDCSYCIDHAIEALSKDQGLLKYCKLLFAYDEEEMEELVAKVKARIESKTQKKQKEKATSNGGGKN